ncbi:MAG: hypothetical protein ABIT09_07890 [Croceibacterium sp.]
MRLAIDARLITTHGDFPVRLDNLSGTGALVSRPKQDVFTACVLKWLGLEAWGQLVWMRGGYCGIRFDRPLPPEWVESTRAVPAELPEGWKLATPSRVRRI